MRTEFLGSWNFTFGRPAMKYAFMNWMIRPDLVMGSKEAIGALMEHTRYMKGL